MISQGPGIPLQRCPGDHLFSISKSPTRFFKDTYPSYMRADIAHFERSQARNRVRESCNLTHNVHLGPLLAILLFKVAFLTAEHRVGRRSAGTAHSDAAAARKLTVNYPGRGACRRHSWPEPFRRSCRLRRWEVTANTLRDV